MRLVELTLGTGLLFAAPALHAQTCELVKDIDAAGNPIWSDPRSYRPTSGGKFASDYLRLGKSWYFLATTNAAGQELWRTDGTAAGTALVKDINPGRAGAAIREMIRCGACIYFQATTASGGAELWKSDGTAAGTGQVKDIRPGPAGSRPGYLECFQGKVYFSADDGEKGAELWCSDGTSAGTVLVKDINPGSQHGAPSNLNALDNGKALLFAATDGTNGSELWKSDGTASGTVMVANIRPGSTSSYPGQLTDLGGAMIFRATGPLGLELYRSDGVTATLLKDIRPGTNGSLVNLSWAEDSRIGNRIFFSAHNGTNGRELWTTDGTPVGTTMVKDVAVGAGSSNPSTMYSDGTTLYVHLASMSGGQLWTSDGTLRGTRHLPFAGRSPRVFIKQGKHVFFAAHTYAHGSELWKTDGTAAGTVMVKDAVEGRSSGGPQNLTATQDGRLIYSCRDAERGRELYESDGTAAGTKLLKDIRPGLATGSSYPSMLAVRADGTVFFRAYDRVAGAELWKSDGTAAGTKLVKDIRPGSVSSAPGDLVLCGDTLYFTANDGTHGIELWKSDGTSAGTVLVKDVVAGTGNFSPSQLTCCGETLFFRGNDGKTNTELWKSDGTAQGTVIVKDINPGPSASVPSDLMCCNGMLFFRARTNTHGDELWKSDGSAAGTVMVKDIQPGTGWSSPMRFAACGCTLYFMANTVATGRELWKSDGTPEGTILVKDIEPGAGSSTPSSIVCCGGTCSAAGPGKHRVFFNAYTSVSGQELWTSDGTAAGTTLLKDLRPGKWGSGPRHLTCANGRLFFAAYAQGLGKELWVSDGTETGTVLVKDLGLGVSSSPESLVVVGDLVYFTGLLSHAVGRQLWVSDGTAAGTKLACETFQLEGDGKPGNLVVCNGDLYFTGDDRIHGTELHVLRRPGPSAVPINAAPSTPHGQNCIGATLTSTAPKLGRAARLTGSCGPANHTGVTFVSPAPSRSTPMPGGCRSFLDISAFFVVETFIGRSYCHDLAIPADRSVNGLKVVAQTFFVNNATVLPVLTSNGLILSIGS